MKTQTAQERRRLKRQMLAYYLPVLEKKTRQIIGHLVDMSPVGFLMDAKIPIQLKVEYDLHLDFMEAVLGKDSLEFKARSKWCRQDAITPFLYNSGFEITEIAPDGIEVIKRIAEKYSA